MKYDIQMHLKLQTIEVSIAKWVFTSVFSGIEKQTSEVVTAKIVETAYFAAFMCLKSDKHVVSPKYSSFSPFGNESVKFQFEEGTFKDTNAILECKVSLIVIIYSHNLFMHVLADNSKYLYCPTNRLELIRKPIFCIKCRSRVLS